MKFAELLLGLQIVRHGGDWSADLNQVVYDSRKARQGSLFVCVTGFVTDGHQYIDQAINQGVSALLVEHVTPALLAADCKVAWAEIADTRRGLAHVSDRFFDHPSGKIQMIGITGTKGKTTTTYMARAILAAAGRQAGLIGTVANIIGDQITYASRTTPESYDLQALLDDMVVQKQDSCVMEVSSQGLMLDRVYGCDYQVGVFTNLYNDHIGPHEHATMDDYLAAKLLLMSRCHQAIINRDLEIYDHVLAAAQNAQVPALAYGLSSNADIRAENLHQITQNGLVGTAFDLVSPWFSGEVFVGMPGKFNVYNALAAIASTACLGVDFAAIRLGLATIAVPGRVQPIPTGRDFQVIVDYAHNAASLDSLLKTMREYTKGRLIVLFGNGGDRARSRRFEMGEVAGRLADLTVITSDNPRTEDPMAIIEDIITGIAPTGGRYEIVPDRRTAIGYAIDLAQPGDMVVIAGKGHENYQIFKDKTIHFDDAETAAEMLAMAHSADASRV
ncbi:MAG: UDP-N-acetylmuramoyl-L-alanyl-D-glutamate--2,6-diaminopimelate ligase [Eubacteriales bacterium]|nr:UDP-N-acetylmuramoyl-L-alanyl-D-glutamate--2,6-diaminopimelate ligase [Eubacteriales bacterium]